MSKIAVSLPRDVVRRARRAVERGRAPSMDAYVAAAVAQQTKIDEVDDLVHIMLAETRRSSTAFVHRGVAAARGSSRSNTRRKRPVRRAAPH